MSNIPSNLDNALEVIGQAIHDHMGLTPANKEDKTAITNVNVFLEAAINSYVLVQWPESQEFMEEEWFNEEAILEVEGKFGSSAYFIPLKRVIK